MLLTISMILLLFPHQLLATAPATNRTERTILNCTVKGGECDETKGRVVCGTDNQTYATRCHLIRAQCAGHKVQLKHRGPCKDHYSYTECLKSRAYALAHRSASPKKFLPRCRSDGTYAAVQCMGGAGCWCSDGQGKPIPNTTTTNGKPMCPKISKMNIRRSPARSRSSANQSNRRICRRSDQRQFSVNLKKVFANEYNRLHPVDESTDDQTILQWKFNELDSNRDGKLQKFEFRILRRLVRKVIKPKRCAKAFGRQIHCDSDLNEQLTLQEWTDCLINDDFIDDSYAFGANIFDDSDEDEEEDYEEIDASEDSSGAETNGRPKSFGRRKPFLTPVTPYPPVYLLRSKAIVESDAVLRESESESDCLSDRAAALDEQKNGAEAIYVPECTADGRYQRIQCYRSAGYCWCVHEDTGKNIPGTSVKDGRPDCMTNTTRPMKGCAEPKKNEFLRELKEFLRTQIANNANAGANTTHWKNEEERIATLSFVLLDKNKNKVWERKEWKIFRDLVTTEKVLRKCGKKMPRYCDVNNDKKITLSEWLNCLQINNNPTLTKSSENSSKKPLQSSSKLKGPNPLDSYLKSD